MIKYIDWGEHLRLGNWLFLYAGIQSISKDSGNELVVPPFWMWDYFEHSPTISSDKSYEELFHFRQFNYSKEEYDYLVKFFTENKDKVVNINLGSHLQSEKWFQHNIEHIKTCLTIKQEKIDNVRQKYAHFFDKPTIGIGIRRGDFVNHGVFYQIPETWYKQALIANFDVDRYNVVVFSDDIDWCKKYFKNENFMYAEANNTHLHTEGFKYYRKDPMEQFILASMMDNFIGGSSTFSWWNMWMVKNFNNGTIIHSGKNLSVAGEKQFGVNKNYYPTNWIEFPVKEKKWVNNNDGSFSYENM